MSKRGAESQGGDERYGAYSNQQSGMNSTNTSHRATAAQLANRKIATAKSSIRSGRSSRQGTPSANPFAGGQVQTQNQSQNPSQTMSFQPGSNSFTFSAGTGAPAAPTFGDAGLFGSGSTAFGGVGTQQQNGMSSIFGNSNVAFGAGARDGSSTPQPQPNGFAPAPSIFAPSQNNATGGDNSTAKATTSFGGFGNNNNNSNNTTPSLFSGSFGQQQNTSTTNPFAGFGQNQPQQNGTTSLTSTFSFGSTAGQPQQNKQSSFAGENSSQPQQNTQSTPATSFGAAVQPQQNGGHSLFGAKLSSATTSNNDDLFKNSSVQSSSNQPNGDKPFSLFSSASQQTQTSQTASSTMPQENGSQRTGLFGSPAPPATSTNSGDSVLSGLNKQNSNQIKPGMFTSNTNNAATPTPNNLFGGFGQQSRQDDTPVAGTNDQINKSNSLTGGKSSFQQPSFNNGGNLFSSAAHNAQSTPKPTMGFSFGSTQSQPSQQTPTQLFGQNKQQEDTSMQTPDSTPKKATGFTPAPARAQASFGSSLFQPAPTASDNNNNNNDTVTNNGSQGKSLFERITNDDAPAIAQPSPKSAALPSWVDSSTIVPATQSQAKSAEKAETLSTNSGTLSQTTMRESLSAAERDTFKSLNEGIKAHIATQNPLVDWSTIFEYYLTKAAEIRNKSPPKLEGRRTSTAAGAGAQSKPPATKPQTSIFSQVSNVATPKGVPAPLNARDLSKTAPVKLNMKRGPVEEGDDDVPGAATAKRVRSGEEYASLPKEASATAKLFQSAYNTSATEQSIAKTPEFGPPAGMLEKAREDKAKAQAESGMTASGSTSVGFQPTSSSTLKSSTTGFNPATAQSGGTDKAFKPATTFTPIGSQSDSFSGFKPSTTSAIPSTKSANESQGFKPTGFTPMSTQSSGATGFKPSGFTPAGLSAGMPTTAAGPTNFMAAFGQKASEQAESDKKKRKAEDYDSDEDTEEIWEERDKAEQEAKRHKILEAAKAAKGFTLSTPATGAPNPQNHKATTNAMGLKPLPAAAQTPQPATRSLFDRISPADAPATEPPVKSLFNFNTTAANANNTSFGLIAKSESRPDSSPQADKTDAEKAQGSGDHTWKPATPLKFGASVSNASSTPAATSSLTNAPFGGIFGNSAANDKAPTGTPSVFSHLKAPGVKSSLNFDFGGTPSVNGSRSATPGGFTTDGEGTTTGGEGGDEADEAPKDPQVEDQTGLRDEEKEHEDLLLSIPIAKCQKWADKGGETKSGWTERGKGPLYILKHKETGKTRVILKLPPFGKPCMNFEVLKGMPYLNASAKTVKCHFIDHFQPNPADKNKPSTWLIQVGKPEDATQIQKVLAEAAQK